MGASYDASPEELATAAVPEDCAPTKVAPGSPTVQGPPAADDIDVEQVVELVGEWVPLPDIAARYGVPVTRVRRHLADRELLALRVGPRRALAVPERFLGPAGPWPQLKGTFTVLADGGMSDVEILRWLFTPDPTLPGTPVEGLLGGQKREVRRRAQALAF